jgi:hypothetical protein
LEFLALVAFTPSFILTTFFFADCVRPRPILQDKDIWWNEQTRSWYISEKWEDRELNYITTSTTTHTDTHLARRLFSMSFFFFFCCLPGNRVPATVTEDDTDRQTDRQTNTQMNVRCEMIYQNISMVYGFFSSFVCLIISHHLWHHLWDPQTALTIIDIVESSLYQSLWSALCSLISSDYKL